MIVSKYRKTYDTANGTEQPFGKSTRVRSEDASAANEPVTLMETLKSKPAWSVLSLNDLVAKIRQGRKPDDPWRVYESAQQAQREEARVREVGEPRVDEKARSFRDEHRNACENP